MCGGMGEVVVMVGVGIVVDDGGGDWGEKNVIVG